MEQKDMMKDIIIVWLIAGLILIGVMGCAGPATKGNQNTTANQSANATQVYPSAAGIELTYCQGLGYKYEYRLDNTTGEWAEYCRLSPDVECEAWAFVGGECAAGRPFMLCSLKNYTLKIGIEPHGSYNISYPICIFPDGTYCKEVDFYNRKCHVLW